MQKIWYTKEVKTSFTETLQNIELSLKEEWFWVLSKIDMKAKLKEKLNKDIENYMILWACNPKLASEALDLEYEIWLLLPCNIIVYSKGNSVFVSAIMPKSTMNLINKNMNEIAEVAEQKLKKAIDSL